MDMVFKSIGFITDFSLWDDLINERVLSFKDEYRVYPNIMCASGETYDKIDLYAQKHHDRIVNAGDGEPLGKSAEPYHGIDTFIAAGYTLELCRDEDLAEGAFTLVYDEDPDFDGEPLEEEFSETSLYSYKKSA